MKQFKSLFPLILLCLALPAKAVLLMQWERLPLAIPLVVGQERVIFVDRNVRIGMPASLNNKLRVQTTGGTVYLLAQETIAPTRLQLQDSQTGELILIDIATLPLGTEQTQLEPVHIIEGENPARRYGGQTTPGTSDKSQANRETPVPVVLIRYAAQMLYAPLRTVEPVQGISSVNLRHNLHLDSLLPTLPVKASALAAWHLEDDWVTAVKLENMTATALMLDPRLLQGDFIAATFQHHDLGPAGAPSDTTVLYLVTRKHGLSESLLPAISAVDASGNLPVNPPTRGGQP